MNRGDMILPERSLLSFPGGEAGRELYCVDGLLWITRAGDPVDHLLRAGDRFPLDGAGRIVVESLARSLLRVSRSLTPAFAEEPSSGAA